MAVSENSTLVNFDADAALTAVRAVDEDGLHLCVEYTPESFRTMYADELTMGLYRDREEMEAHFEEIHSFVHIDFSEKDMFGELFRGAGDVRSFVTYMDHVALVRVLVGREGVFFTLDPDADVTAAVQAVEDEVH